MAHYVIGDVQGCYDGLNHLLEEIKYDQTEDTLWFTGDLVNRGTQSLKVLRLVLSLGDKVRTVLGNHDLHLLAVFYDCVSHEEPHTFDDVLEADDAPILVTWLRKQPFMLHDASLNYAMVHAGVHPHWTLENAQGYSNELQGLLAGVEFKSYLTHMYGNEPRQWAAGLKGLDRARVLTNYFTRVRLVTDDGELDYSFKGHADEAPLGLYPWYTLLNTAHWPCRIAFGHWAALRGHCHVKDVFALDTGYVWGEELTAMRLEDQRLFSVKHP